MNKENFTLSKETTVREILDYARSYCKELPDCDEQDRLCFNCKLAPICGSFVDEWTFPKTYKEDFLEKFPNARTTKDNIPIVCRENVYGGILVVCCNNCLECWNQLMRRENE